jgi:putative membrane protein
MVWVDNQLSGWAWLAMVVMMVAGVAATVLAVLVLVRAARPQREVAAPATPLKVLADRFARGEIDEDEYRSRLSVLTAEPAVSNRRPAD